MTNQFTYNYPDYDLFLDCLLCWVGFLNHLWKDMCMCMCTL